MKAVQFAEYGGPAKLQIVEVDEPYAGAGQVRIAVRAAGVNGIDWKMRFGFMREQMPLSLPAGTGKDAAGSIGSACAPARDHLLRRGRMRDEGPCTSSLCETMVLDTLMPTGNTRRCA